MAHGMSQQGMSQASGVPRYQGDIHQVGYCLQPSQQGTPIWAMQQANFHFLHDHFLLVHIRIRYQYQARRQPLQHHMHAPATR